MSDAGSTGTPTSGPAPTTGETTATTTTPSLQENEPAIEGFEEQQAKQLSRAGLIFVYAGMGTLLLAVLASILLVIRGAYPTGAVEFFSYYGLPLLLVIASGLFSGFGYMVLRTVSSARRQVIPPQDRQLLTQLIQGDPPTGLDAYVRLSALSGITGFFHKIGVSGLPLATISLTLVFALLAISGLGPAGAFADLANLALGAFLGSYVQRQTPGQGQVGPPTG
jgi:hypothetical protein